MSDSEPETSSPAVPSSPKNLQQAQDSSIDSMTEAEVTAAFTQFYARQATQEFAEDLDRVRRAEDFREVEGVEMLITALRQGASLFSIDEMRRVVRAEREKERARAAG